LFCRPLLFSISFWEYEIHHNWPLGTVRFSCFGPYLKDSGEQGLWFWFGLTLLFDLRQHDTLLVRISSQSSSRVLRFLRQGVVQAKVEKVRQVPKSRLKSLFFSPWFCHLPLLRSCLFCVLRASPSGQLEQQVFLKKYTYSINNFPSVETAIMAIFNELAVLL
jgi:hypothetical protein